MPQEASACAAPSNPLIAYSNQKEWRKATARVNSAWAAALHEVGKLTVPSFSVVCWALDGRTGRTSNKPMSRAIVSVCIVVFLLPGAESRLVAPGGRDTGHARARHPTGRNAS